MKIKSIIAATLLLGSTAGLASTLDTWTSVAGITIEARFVKEKYGIVYLETSDGAVKQIKLTQLSEQDRKRVNELTDPFAAKRKAEEAQAAETKKAPEELYALFGDTLRNAQKKKASVDTLEGKTIGIYFSAHWCPPCRTFTPRLVEFHNAMAKQGNPFEIVFVSSDNDSNAMYNYMKEMEMPWLALEFDSDLNKTLKGKYEVKGIPMLVIIDSKGNLVTKNGRGDVTQHGDSAFDRWK